MMEQVIGILIGCIIYDGIKYLVRKIFNRKRDTVITVSEIMDIQHRIKRIENEI